MVHRRDEERRAAFDAEGELFESAYHLTFVYLPAPESRARAGRMMLDAPERPAVDWQEQLSGFIEATDRLASLLDGAGMLSVLLFPLIGMALRGDRVSSTTVRVDDEV